MYQRLSWNRGVQLQEAENLVGIGTTEEIKRVNDWRARAFVGSRGSLAWRTAASRKSYDVTTIDTLFSLISPLLGLSPPPCLSLSLCREKRVFLARPVRGRAQARAAERWIRAGTSQPPRPRIPIKLIGITRGSSTECSRGKRFPWSGWNNSHLAERLSRGVRQDSAILPVGKRLRWIWAVQSEVRCLFRLQGIGLPPFPTVLAGSWLSTLRGMVSLYLRFQV